MSAGLDRLIQAEKNSVYDKIIVAIDAAQDAVSTAWSIFDDLEKAELVDIESELRDLRAQYRAVLKGARR